MRRLRTLLLAACCAPMLASADAGRLLATGGATSIEGAAGGGLVKVRATARGRILGVSIDDSLMKPEEKQMVEDLVTAAFNDARDRADRVSAEEMDKIQQGVGLPAGFKLPGM